MTDKGPAATQKKSQPIQAQAELGRRLDRLKINHGERLHKLEDEVFPPPPGGPSQFQRTSEEVSKLAARVKELETTIEEIATTVVTMGFLESEVAIQKAQIQLLLNKRTFRAGA